MYKLIIFIVLNYICVFYSKRKGKEMKKNEKKKKNLLNPLPIYFFVLFYHNFYFTKTNILFVVI